MIPGYEDQIERILGEVAGFDYMRKNWNVHVFRAFTDVPKNGAWISREPMGRTCLVIEGEDAALEPILAEVGVLVRSVDSRSAGQ